MRHLLLTAAVLALAVPAASAASGDVNGFTAIDAQGRYRVEVRIGDHSEVRVDGPDAAGVSIQSDGHTLQLRETNQNDTGRGSHRLNAVVHIITPALTAIDSSRGMEFAADGIRADQLDVHGSMGTEIRLNGACGALTVHASMGADIDAKGLDCASAQVDANMGADVEVRAHESATANASMGGDIRVRGNPRQREHHVGLGGDVSFE